MIRLSDILGHTPECRCASCMYQANNPWQPVYAIGTQIEDIEIRVEMHVGRYITAMTIQGFRRKAIMDTASVAVSERPRNAVERRQHAIAVLLYKHICNGPYDFPAIMEDLTRLKAMGRTARWIGTVNTWMKLVQHSDIEWALDQGAINANYAAL